MKLMIAAPITAALLVLGAGIAITSPWPVEAGALWVAAFALVVLLSVLLAHVRAPRRSLRDRETPAERDRGERPSLGVDRRFARKGLSPWRS